MSDWISFKKQPPPIGVDVVLLHNGHWPESHHVEHRAFVYRAPDGAADPRPHAGYCGHFATDTITHWKPLPSAEEEE